MRYEIRLTPVITTSSVVYQVKIVEWLQRDPSCSFDYNSDCDYVARLYVVVGFGGCDMEESSKKVTMFQKSVEVGGDRAHFL